ncbi:RAN GTPase-activating protein 1, partial [Linum grandiflorum]
HNFNPTKFPSIFYARPPLSLPPNSPLPPPLPDLTHQSTAISRLTLPISTTPTLKLLITAPHPPSFLPCKSRVPGSQLSFLRLFPSHSLRQIDMDCPAPVFQPRQVSVKMWPPSQSTRLTLIERMTKNLTTPSTISRKYGLLSKEEAEEDAKKIEQVAFDAASQHYEKEPDGDGSSSVLLYAKESSKFMLEVLKRGPKVKEEEEDISAEPDDNIPQISVFDISGGQRAFVEATEAEDLLRPLTEPGNSFTRICFSNRSFGLDAALVAKPILSSIKDQLTEVDLSDFVAGRPEAEALQVMNDFSSALEGCNLRYLDLSNNALGEKGVRAFASLIKSQHNLEELYLINDGISEEAAQAVNELLPSTEKLRVLQFHNNMTGDEGAIAIAKIVRRANLLEDFRCSSTRVGAEGGVALAEALETCTHMRKLDLRDNMFGVEAGLALSKALLALTNLTEVYLNYLNLEDEGAEVIANALKDSAPSLAVLDMAGNDITVKGASSLADCILVKRLLTKLNLAENELKDEGTILIAKAIEAGHNQLNEVDFSTNAIRRAGARVLAQVVVNKPGFKLLNLNGNFISDEGLDEVKTIFKNLPDLLGPLDENDPEGEDFDEDDNDGDGDEDELESKLKGLEIKHEE